VDIQPVYGPENRIERWEGHNLTDGYSVIVRPCADNSGFIAKVEDFFTGDILHQLLGSTVDSTALGAVERMNRTSLYTTLAHI